MCSCVNVFVCAYVHIRTAHTCYKHVCAHTVPTVPTLIKTHNSVLYSQAQLVWVHGRQVCILQVLF